MQTIMSIVEGSGEVAALPILLRRLEPGAIFSTPWKTSGRHSMTPERVERILLTFKSRDRCDGVLILRDSDEECPVEEAWKLSDRAASLNLPFPVAVVLAQREYEAWFLASLELLAGKYGIPSGTTIPENKIESIRGAKEWLARQMPTGRGYSETRDQPAFTALMDLDLVRGRSRSFHRLEHALQELLVGEPRVTPLRPD